VAVGCSGRTHAQEAMLFRRGPRACFAGRRGNRGEGDYSDSEYFDLRRSERQRARAGEGGDSMDEYESRLNRRLRSSVSSTSSPYGDFSGFAPADDDEDEYERKGNVGLLRKINQAWEIFFPKRKRNLSNLSPREAGKNRLRMILVADRNSLSKEVMQDMKETIVKALEDYVEIKNQQDVNLSMSTDGSEGTVYSVSVPVKCVKPEKRSYFSPDGIVEDGETLMTQDDWDQWDEDPKARFPWGT